MIAQTWKQPRRPSLVKWVNKLVHPDRGVLFRSDVTKLATQVVPDFIPHHKSS